MKTSARNNFNGEVIQLKLGAVNDVIELRLASGSIITSIITHGSTERLGLKVGSKAFALIKSSSVIIAIETENTKFSTRNCLAGKVINIVPGAVNSEVVIDLGKNEAIVAIITNGSCKNLGLQVGTQASAIFKASSVILGTTA